MTQSACACEPRYKYSSFVIYSCTQLQLSPLHLSSKCSFLQLLPFLPHLFLFALRRTLSALVAAVASLSIPRPFQQLLEMSSSLHCRSPLGLIIHLCTQRLTHNSPCSESGSHTATQSTFAAPCTALQGGVDSGPCVLASSHTLPCHQATHLRSFSSRKPAAATPPTFNYTVADANPVWFYCATGTHCKSGMVFAVNPSADQSFAAFQAAAKGEAPSSSAGASPATTSLSATAKLSGPDGTTSASATSKDSSGSGNGYGYGSGGASGRAPIAVGAVAAALVLGALAAI